MVKLGLLIFNGCSFSLFKYILVSVEHASQYLITVCFGLKLLIMKHLKGRCAEQLGFSCLRAAVKTEAPFPLHLPGAAQWLLLLRAIGALCPVPVEAANPQPCLVPVGSMALPWPRAVAAGSRWPGKTAYRKQLAQDSHGFQQPQTAPGAQQKPQPTALAVVPLL